MIRPFSPSLPLAFSICLALAAPAVAQEEKAGDAGKLPIKRIVMFNSGVAFFEHLGDVEGDDEIDLSFKVEDINDLLKSMVLQDLGGGRITTVSYGSRDPITKTLKSFAIDLTDSPTLAELLAQARGESVRVEAPNEIEGIIISVESRKEKVDDEVVEVQYLNLLTEEGLRSVNLSHAGKINFLDPNLDAELREALRILATAHATDKKTVSLKFVGEGERPVRVGYIQEAPVWKTSYRLVLDDENPPFLQGWSIVENQTDHDWTDITLSLVSGRPISFVMDLYSPLYAPRPIVEPELYASLRPKMYDQDLDRDEAEFRKMADARRFKGEQERAAGAAPAADGLARQREARGFGGGYAGKGKADEAKQLLNLQDGVKSVAQADDVGEMFKYTINTPVTIKRQRSAMLPIVNESVQGEKVSIYNQSVHAKHPLNGLKLTNSSGLLLMQGPVTVFDDGVYAGDAQIPNLPPGSERLISYAMDLDVEVAPSSTAGPEQIVDVRLVKGTLYTSRKYSRTHTYTVKNSGQEEKTVLIEYPIDTSWKLIEPKEPAQKTRDEYRFAVAAEPGVPAKLVVEEERVVSQSAAVTNLDSNAIVIYINSKVVSDEIKAALKEVIHRKAELQEVVNERNRLSQQIAVVGQEQDRIRKNMAEVPKDSDLFKRYIQKFTAQEDTIEELREKIKELQAEEVKLRKALDEYLMGLELT